MTIEDVRRLLVQQCDAVGGQTAFAAKHDLTKAYVSQVVLGQRPPSEKLCDALGVREDGMRYKRK